MKSFVSALVIACFVGAAQAQEETPWFDMEKCEICKTMAGVDGMMQNIKWENHMIPNGMLSIAVVPDEFKGPMEKAHESMKATIAKLEGGQSMHLCGHCKSYGALKAAGAESTELETVGGNITLMTSNDAEVVKKIQQHAKTSVEQFEMMMGHDENGDHED